jgi:phospholipid N-methyltransferase
MTAMAQEQQTVATWSLARRVVSGFVQPGGRAMVERAMEGASLDEGSRVVELAPGLGVTSALLLQRHPRTWTGVEPDPAAASHLRRSFAGAGREVVAGPIEATGLEGGVASVVVADGLLSTLPEAGRTAVLLEAARLLRAGGRLVLHEIVPASAGGRDAGPDLAAVGIDLVGVDGWRASLEEAGLAVVGSLTGPLDLAAPADLMREAGPRGSLRITREMAVEAAVRAPAMAAREVLTRHALALRSVVVVAEMPLVLGMRRQRR